LFLHQEEIITLELQEINLLNLEFLLQEVNLQELFQHQEALISVVEDHQAAEALWEVEDHQAAEVVAEEDKINFKKPV
jgi:hypothetical protein